jgi:rare lipoprotein A
MHQPSSGPINQQSMRGSNAVNQRKFFTGSAIFMLTIGSVLTVSADHSTALAAAIKKATPDKDDVAIDLNKAKSPAKAASAKSVAKAKKPNFNQVGTASWYGPGLRGHKTANGDTLDPTALTAAHRSLPLDSRVRVTNLKNGKSVDVVVNDRGPYHNGRVIDLSVKAAQQLDITHAGIAQVRIEALPYVQIAVAPPAGEPAR